MICKKCEWWRNQQAELGYTEFRGICTSPRRKFNSSSNDDVRVMDRRNIPAPPNTSGTHEFEHQNDQVPIGQRNARRYCLVTGPDFGCTHYESKKK